MHPRGSDTNASPVTPSPRVDRIMRFPPLRFKGRPRRECGGRRSRSCHEVPGKPRKTGVFGGTPRVAGRRSAEKKHLCPGWSVSPCGWPRFLLQKLRSAHLLDLFLLARCGAARVARHLRGHRMLIPWRCRCDCVGGMTPPASASRRSTRPGFVSAMRNAAEQRGLSHRRGLVWNPVPP